ncbi:Uncharacterised protein [Vibrio cholerae]|nr:Uncharacterised protein [Vibrio cholerae]CSC81559.1 Uncharacterised protein [Vibrio cholerae]CSD20163.1 Uncharacterised protein [Vibrio cholerae]CSI45452.1 Uncharacterised protein [Vibrio cholerae]CSI64743.1 Uncharacterised protein [Vibrio cholerae]
MRITSEANALPPGLSTRSTTAFTLLSLRASRSNPATVSPPTVPRGCEPSIIAPLATTTAISLASVSVVGLMVVLYS